jgi:hypothetical protein
MQKDEITRVTTFIYTLLTQNALSGHSNTHCTNISLHDNGCITAKAYWENPVQPDTPRCIHTSFRLRLSSSGCFLLAFPATTYSFLRI